MEIKFSFFLSAGGWYSDDKYIQFMEFCTQLARQSQLTLDNMLYQSSIIGSTASFNIC